MGFEFGVVRGLAVEFISIFCKEDFPQIKFGKVGKPFVEFVEFGKVVLVGFCGHCFFLFHSASNL